MTISDFKFWSLLRLEISCDQILSVNVVAHISSLSNETQ